MNEPKPGSIGLSIIGGKTGALVAAGQAITGDGSRWTHAFIVVDNDEVVEGMPGGARLTKLADRIDDDGGIVFSDRPVAEALTGLEASTPAPNWDDEWRGFYERNLRQDICQVARGMVGTPYSFLDYVAMAFTHFGIHAGWLRRYMLSKNHMICSQLVDEAFRRVGIHMFNDGRLPMDVTPGDIANRYGIT